MTNNSLTYLAAITVNVVVVVGNANKSSCSLANCVQLKSNNFLLLPLKANGKGENGYGKLAIGNDIQ